MGLSTTALFALAAGSTAAATVYSAEKQSSAAKSARKDAAANAKATSDAADQANNKTNQKRPNANTLLADNQAQNMGGGTLLTGPQGIDPNLLTLGKTTLLGG